MVFRKGVDIFIYIRYKWLIRYDVSGNGKECFNERNIVDRIDKMIVNGERKNKNDVEVVNVYDKYVVLWKEI